MSKVGAMISVTAFAVLLSVSSACAQATRTWVSGVGDDANPCSRTAPCKTFAGAISKTADSGEINCIDPGGFGAVTITKNLTIDCGGTYGSVLASGTNGIVITNSDATTVLNVTIRNLSINGAPAVTPGLNGIRFLVSGSLHLDHVIVENFTGGGQGNGVDFRPNNSSKLHISNSYFINNGTGSTGAGVRFSGTAGGTTAVIEKTMIDRGTIGVLADSTAGGAVNVTVRDSAIASNLQSGGLANGSTAGIMILNSSIIGNTIGLNASGAGIVRVGGSVITGNATATSGNVLSYLNNQINGNSADTTPSSAGGTH